jgi:low temperature requirement protein LtrA
VAAGRVADGVVGYASVFFAIWWAWMNFTWFASAYDTDDIAYRVTTLVQIAGALILAAGVPEAMGAADLTVVTAGYVVMRLAMVTQWLRAAAGDPPHRRSSLRFAAGIAALQVGWVLRLLLPEGPGYAAFLVLVAGELAVPVWAERAAPTTWHPRHIAERYGLFTLIVLGETVLAATVAIQTALDAHAALGDLATTAAGGLLTVFGMWWLYFAKEAHELLTSLRAGIVWGYGHYLVFPRPRPSGPAWPSTSTWSPTTPRSAPARRRPPSPSRSPCSCWRCGRCRCDPTTWAAGTARLCPPPRCWCWPRPSRPSRSWSPACCWRP